MTVGTVISFIINIAVGVYFARYYPRHVQKQFRDRPVPPFFAAMAALLRPVGYLLIAGTLVYATLLVVNG